MFSRASSDEYYSSLAARTAAVATTSQTLSSARAEDRRRELENLENAIRCLDLYITRESARRDSVLTELDAMVERTLLALRMLAKQSISGLRRKYIDSLTKYSEEVDSVQIQTHDVKGMDTLSRNVKADVNRLYDRVQRLAETSEEGEKALLADILKLENKIEQHLPQLENNESQVVDQIVEATKKDEDVATDLKLKLGFVESRVNKLLKRREESEQAFYDTLNKLIRSVESAISRNVGF